VVGPRGTHGALFDWIQKLKNNKEELEVLGDGTQTKSYLSVHDCIDGIIYGIENSNEKLSILNLGSDDQINVKGMAELLIKEMGTDTKIRYTGGDRGWKSDVPIMKLDTKLMKSIGWSAKHNSEEAVRISIRALMKEIL
jgi:UDP-glucose 4-epimerase